ncbi:MAG TPA: DUF5668 domain-containing protein [Verrucomicrobiae bacterium]|nr:DUF5668 domain-containing protein [Verrucomicrobiae bacterium]
MVHSATASGPSETVRQRRRVYKGISWGVFLVVTGVILLMNTTGRLPFGVWADLLRFWPVLLISMGVRLTFSGTRLHPLALLGPVLVVATATWIVAGYGPAHRGLEDDGGARTESLVCERPRAGGPFVLDLDFAAGRLRVRGAEPAPAADPNSAVAPSASRPTGSLTGEVRTWGESVRWDCTDGELTVGRRGDFSSFHVYGPFAYADSRWEARLRATGPVRLRARLAAANADLDLRTFELERADIHLAASDLALRLAAPKGPVTIRLNGAVSHVSLDVPEGVCVSVSRDWALDVLDFEGRRSGRGRHRSSASSSCDGLASDAPRYELRYNLPLSAVAVEAAGAS